MDVVSVLRNYGEYTFAMDKEVKENAKKKLPPQIIWINRFMGYSLLAGLGSGAFIEGRQRSHQFLAENAHRLPKTKGGWYFYHQAKNNEMIMAGIRGGLKYGFYFASITGCFATCEAALEHQLGREGILSAMGAGFLSSVAFSLITRLGSKYNKQYRRHAIFLGLYGGFTIGLSEELYALVLGRSIKYPDAELKKWSDYKIGQELKSKWNSLFQDS